MTLDDLTASRGHPVCLARVLVDYVPSPYDKEALRLKVCHMSLISYIPLHNYSKNSTLILCM